MLFFISALNDTVKYLVLKVCFEDYFLRNPF